MRRQLGVAAPPSSTNVRSQPARPNAAMTVSSCGPTGAASRISADGQAISSAGPPRIAGVIAVLRFVIPKSRVWTSQRDRQRGRRLLQQVGDAGVRVAAAGALAGEDVGHLRPARPVARRRDAPRRCRRRHPGRGRACGSHTGGRGSATIRTARRSPRGRAACSAGYSRPLESPRAPSSSAARRLARHAARSTSARRPTCVVQRRAAGCRSGTEVPTLIAGRAARGLEIAADGPPVDRPDPGAPAVDVGGEARVASGRAGSARSRGRSSDDLGRHALGDRAVGASDRRAA